MIKKHLLEIAVSIYKMEIKFLYSSGKWFTPRRMIREKLVLKLNGYISILLQ